MSLFHTQRNISVPLLRNSKLIDCVYLYFTQYILSLETDVGKICLNFFVQISLLRQCSVQKSGFWNDFQCSTTPFYTNLSSRAVEFPLYRPNSKYTGGKLNKNIKITFFLLKYRHF